MTGQCLTAECKERFQMCEGLANFTELIASRAQQWGSNFATAIRKTTIADEVNKDTRTITRYINQLEDLGLAEIETKRGRNGGTVVMFNKNLLNFEPTNNPITSETKEASEIREQVFPTVPKKQPKRRYRTKAQIAEEKALRTQTENENIRLNDLLDATPVLKRDFFDNFAEPRLAFQGYLLAQMYTAYAVIFPKNRHEFYIDIDPAKAESALKAFNRAKSYSVLVPRFVGTPQYNKFVELAKFLNEHDINPLSYLTVQFEHTEWMANMGYARKEAIPYVNSLLSQEAIDRYYAREKFIKDQRKKNLFGLSPYKVPFVGSKYPIISVLQRVYQQDRYQGDQVDIVIDRLINRSIFDTSLKREALASYYTSVIDAIEESALSKEDADKLTRFMKEQVALYAERGGLNLMHYIMAFPLQTYQIRTTMEMMGFTQEEYYGHLGNIHKSTVEDWDYYVQNGEKIDFCYNANKTFLATNRLLADCQGLGVLPNEISGILTEFGVEKVPLDRFGLLDVARIYKEALTEEELEAEKAWEREALTRV